MSTEYCLTEKVNSDPMSRTVNPVTQIAEPP